MVEFSLKKCGGIFGMLYFDASWLQTKVTRVILRQSTSCINLNQVISVFVFLEHVNSQISFSCQTIQFEKALSFTGRRAFPSFQLRPTLWSD